MNTIFFRSKQNLEDSLCPSTLLVFAEINRLVKMLHIICVQILREGVLRIWKVSGEGWGSVVLLPSITDHYKASFLAWTFSLYVQDIVLSVDA